MTTKANTDTKPEWLKNMRIVKASCPQDERTYGLIKHGYKLVSAKMRGCADYEYKVGRHYEHDGLIRLCQSGFHFSTDPLQCIRYAESMQLEKPWHLLTVVGSGEIQHGPDKMCCQKLHVVSEIKKEEEIQKLLTGISITDGEIRCYKNGLLDDPDPECPALCQTGDIYFYKFSYHGGVNVDEDASLLASRSVVPFASWSLIMSHSS
jgi:hypothetical protein